MVVPDDVWREYMKSTYMTFGGFMRKKHADASKSESPLNPHISISGGKKTACMGAVGDYFGVCGAVDYLQYPKDMIRALNKKIFYGGMGIGQTEWRYAPGPTAHTLFRRDKTKRINTPKIKTVGGSRKVHAKLAREQKGKFPLGFVVFVKEHVLALSNKGETIVDTAPRRSDRRKIESSHQITIFEPRKASQVNKIASSKRIAKRKKESRKRAKIVSGQARLKRCPKGYKRNPKTRRCRKV